MTQPRRSKSLYETTRAKVEAALIARVELIEPESFGHNYERPGADRRHVASELDQSGAGKPARAVYRPVKPA
jgi:hypothetical protein